MNKGKQSCGNTDQCDTMADIGVVSYNIIFLIVSVLCMHTVCYAMIQEIPVPKELEECFDRYAKKTTIRDTVGESIQWFCVNQYVWKMSKQQNWVQVNITSEAYVWFNSLLEIDRHRMKRQAIRKRQEYRMMSDEDRHKFHRAIQMLKADTSIFPNRYDAIASLHESERTTIAAHGGPNFLGWHRVYLLIFENALREKVPDVTLPYWDSTLDAKMRNPMESIIWSEQFMGNGDGIVKTGPFADWQTRSGPLTRNVGMTGQPFRKHIIQNILKKSFVGDITEPHAVPDNNLEFHHSEGHLYVDGQMGALATASQDPIFFCHHAYVDHVWEVFREKQRMDGIDPTTDYPMVVNHTTHHAEAPMGFRNMLNIDSFQNHMIEGIYSYEPVPTCQVGEQHCNSPYIRCVSMGNNAECVSAERPLWTRRPNLNIQNMGPNTVVQQTPMMTMNNMMGGNNMSISVEVRRIPVSKFGMNGEETFLQMSRPLSNNGIPDWLSHSTPQEMLNRRKSADMFAGMQHARPAWLSSQAFRNSMADGVMGRTSETTGMSTMTGIPSTDINNGMQNGVISIGNPINRPFQNTFNINGRSDSRQWAYIPVAIFYKRPPGFAGYQAFPVIDGKPMVKQDVFSSKSFSDLNKQLKSGNPAYFMNCQSGKQSAGAVFVSSTGINYMGKYKEYAVVDHRMPISVSTVFIGVKNPQRGASDVMISASDSCGRVCKPYCRVSGPQGEVSQPCSGMLRVTSDMPKLFGDNFGEAIMGAWNLGNEKSCPGLNVNSVYLSFYCNYEEQWPFPGKVKPVMGEFVQKPISPPQPMKMPIPKPQQQQQPTPVAQQQFLIQQMQIRERQKQMQIAQQQQMQQQLQIQQQQQQHIQVQQQQQQLQQQQQQQQIQRIIQQERQQQMVQTPTMSFMPFAAFFESHFKNLMKMSPTDFFRTFMSLLVNDEIINRHYVVFLKELAWYKLQIKPFGNNKCSLGALYMTFDLDRNKIMNRSLTVQKSENCLFIKKKFI
ncbi:hypothetical protein KUTeg_019042 [Tegillarca granosa]|uniref:Tyrosinase copper-binding domain-containing protein n=1 Tax=Tegillarca granosa TaxID=220873 RepID=A0ABQ9EBD0_TEGGR|nr:hypothetical protein KUTeg_019042 [Tegillarca granosa]